MSRTVSSAAVRAMFDQQTDEAFLCKLKLDHPSWAYSYRFINDRVSHTDVALETWAGFPFQIVLPDDRDDEMPMAQLVLDNVSREIVAELRGIASPMQVTLWIVMASDIDDIVAGPYAFSFNASSWNALTVSGSLEYEPILNMRWPEHDFTPTTTPGIFKL